MLCYNIKVYVSYDLILDTLYICIGDKKMPSSALDAIKETGSKETGKPQENSNDSSTQKQDDFYEFFIVSLIFVSIIPLVCAALFSNDIEVSVLEYIVGRPDILLVALALAVTVICEIGFLNVRRTRFIKACIPALLVIIVWVMFMYGYYQFPDDGSMGYVYRKEIIVVSVVLTTVWSWISMYIANRTNSKIN